jgi:CBS domain containing-hemolysin-like protein
MTAVTEVTLVAGTALVVVLLGVSAFFSGSEIALFSLAPHRVGSLRESTDPRARTLARLREDPHRLLVTILVGNNLVNITMTSVATALLVASLGTGAAVPVATLLMAGLVLVFGEIAPKSYGVANAESLSLSVARPVSTAQTVLYPLVVLFDGLAGVVNRITGGERGIETPYVTREDLSALLRTGEAVGAIDEGEREMVEGVFDLSSTRAREVMVPRVDVVAVDVSASLDEVLEICSDRRLTRLPVYRGTLDHVVGIADIRDVERAAREGSSLEAVLHPTIQVPDTREIDDLLTEMQAERIPMVIVRDEFGETEGILTVEDILEEIVGEIFEVGEERRIRRTDTGLVVRGDVTVGEVNDALDVHLPREGEFETVAGLINAELGRIGDIGDRVAVDDVTLVVDRVEGNRIRRVQVVHESRDGSAADADVDLNRDRDADRGRGPDSDSDADAG